MSDVTDLLKHAIDKSPIEFADTFDQLMQAKAVNAIENHRQMLAQSIYASDDEGPEDVDADEDDIELDDDDTEDYFDDEDDDLDLDDLDLDDLDLDDEDGTDEDA